MGLGLWLLLADDDAIFGSHLTTNHAAPGQSITLSQVTDSTFADPDTGCDENFPAVMWKQCITSTQDAAQNRADSPGIIEPLEISILVSAHNSAILPVLHPCSMVIATSKATAVQLLPPHWRVVKR